MLCNEVLTNLEDGKQYVCEHEAYQEHTHGMLMPYMRPLQSNESTILIDDCLFLEVITCQQV